MWWFGRASGLAGGLIRQRTVRFRLTLLYGGLFIASGICLLALTYVLIEQLSPSLFVAVESKSPGLTWGGLGRPGGVPARVGPTGHSATVIRWAGLSHLLEVSGVALAVMAVIAITMGWFVAGRILRPLRTMTATARSISDHNLHERLAVAGPTDELKELGDTIDGLLSRLEAVVNAQRQFAANASHELRTPLTLERTLLEAILTEPRPTQADWRSTCERVLTSSQRMAALVEALLVLAQSQRRLDHHKLFDLAIVATNVIRASEPVLLAADMTISSTLERHHISGDARLIYHLISNLLQNAIRHNVPRGWVQVAVTVVTHTGEVSLRVINSGPPVPANQIERLLRPFQRMDSQRAGARDGVGLGLSIVKAIADAHAASVHARPGPDGGLDIEVVFPPAHIRRAPELESAAR
jgi:signal transduction histidine kinase